MISLFQRLLDASITLLALYAVLPMLRNRINPAQSLWLVCLFLLALVVFGTFNLYRSWRGSSLWSEMKMVLVAWMTVSSAIFIADHLSGLLLFSSRKIFFHWALLALACLTCVRLFVRSALKWSRSHGKNIRKAVIAGAGSLGTRLIRKIQDHPNYGIRIEALFDDDPSLWGTTIGNVQIVGDTQNLSDYISWQGIEIVYLALPLRAEQRMKELINILEKLPITVYFVPDIFTLSLLNSRLEELEDIPLFPIFSTPFGGAHGLMKRLEDVILAALILVLISPLMLIIAAIIMISSRGPVLFKQRRYGLDGKEFVVYKFRSMTVCEDGKEVSQTQRNDPRVTALGAFLRKTSLDEIPQFLNVLKGDMSIVGPRPHAVAHNEYYSSLVKGYTLRHRVKPGITGWAQINGWRGETDTLEKMSKRIEHDLEYIRNWSLWLDLKIIFLTVVRGFASQNAY
jgi:undecaprenyl-phosphate glucose phosphotransferase